MIDRTKQLRRCENCGEDIGIGWYGPPRRFCNGACRVAGWRKRRDKARGVQKRAELRKTPLQEAIDALNNEMRTRNQSTQKKQEKSE